jgi:hypothetical protein
MTSTPNTASRFIGSGITEPIHSDESNGPKKTLKNNYWRNDYICATGKALTEHKCKTLDEGNLITFPHCMNYISDPLCYVETENLASKSYH